MMRSGLAIVAGATVLAALVPVCARAQLYVSSITAALPDPNGKVPGFNKVPGAGISNWVNGLAQVVLMHGQSYNYCISFGSATAMGTAGVTFKITQGATTVQNGVIIAPKGLQIGPNGIWYLCSGYTVLPASAGAAVLTGDVAYTATGTVKPVVFKLSTSVLLQ